MELQNWLIPQSYWPKTSWRAQVSEKTFFLKWPWLWSLERMKSSKCSHSQTWTPLTQMSHSSPCTKTSLWSLASVDLGWSSFWRQAASTRGTPTMFESLSRVISSNKETWKWKSECSMSTIQSSWSCRYASSHQCLSERTQVQDNSNKLMSLSGIVYESTKNN